MYTFINGSFGRPNLPNSLMNGMAKYLSFFLGFWSTIPGAKGQSTLENITLSTYVWSDEFHKYPVEYFREELSGGKIDHVFISDNHEKQLKQKKIDLRQALDGTSVRIVHLIGYNRWMKMEENHLQLIIDRLPEGDYHLNMEPHTFSDWKPNQQFYQERYIEILKRMQSKGNISISIPFHYDRFFLQRIYSITDQVYIMCYGSQDLETWSQRLQDELFYSNQSIKVTFAPKEFKSLEQLSIYIQDFVSRYQVQNVALHSLNDWLSLKNREN